MATQIGLTTSFIQDQHFSVTNQISNITATYSAAITDCFLVASFSVAPKSITLPLAVYAGIGKTITIISTGLSSSTVLAGTNSANVADQINGASSASVSSGTGAQFISNGVNQWYSF